MRRIGERFAGLLLTVMGLLALVVWFSFDATAPGGRSVHRRPPIPTNDGDTYLAPVATALPAAPSPPPPRAPEKPAEARWVPGRPPPRPPIGAPSASAGSQFFWMHTPRSKPKQSQSISDPPPAKLLYRFGREPGIPKLRLVFEHTFMPTLFDRQGLRKVGFDCRLLEEVNFTSDGTDLCLPPVALEYPPELWELRDFMRPPDCPYERFYDGMLSWGTLLGSQQFPFFSGAAMRYVADAVYETETHFFYLRHSKRWHPVRRTTEVAALPNRSLVYWNLNPFLDDIQVLHRAVTNGSLRSHIFLVSHNQDKLVVPDWLLASPYILKVFSVHLNSTQTHPKLVPLPEGIHPTKGCGLLATARRKSARTRLARLLFAKFQLSCEEREQIFRELNGTDAISEEDMVRRVNKTNYYSYLTEHKFVLAPRGNGLDTFRLWEALYLGRIPVAQNILHPQLLADLPVIFLDRWPQLSRKYLAAQFDKLEVRTFDLNKLWAPWWILHMVRHVLDTP